MHVNNTSQAQGICTTSLGRSQDVRAFLPYPCTHPFRAFLQSTAESDAPKGFVSSVPPMPPQLLAVKRKAGLLPTLYPRSCRINQVSSLHLTSGPVTLPSLPPSHLPCVCPTNMLSLGPQGLCTCAPLPWNIFALDFHMAASSPQKAPPPTPAPSPCFVAFSHLCVYRFNIQHPPLESEPSLLCLQGPSIVQNSSPSRNRAQ